MFPFWSTDDALPSRVEGQRMTDPGRVRHPPSTSAQRTAMSPARRICCLRRTYSTRIPERVKQVGNTEVLPPDAIVFRPIAVT
jgi:hypothetical protein